MNLLDRVEAIERKLNMTRQAPRDGERWNDLEEEILADNLDAVVKRFAVEFGRTENAIVWKIYRIMKEAKR